MKRAAALLLVFIFLLAGCGDLTGIPAPPINAESSYSCSVVQGFNFEKDGQSLVGFINYVKIEDTTLAADLAVTDPENNSNMLKVCGVLSNIYWKGGYADPVQFSAQVSVDNKNKLATLIHKSLSNTLVEFAFTVYDYDPRVKKYYRCFHTNGYLLDGLVYKSGGELAIDVDMDQSNEVVSPKNHTFYLGVMPQDCEMEIHLAVSESDKFVKKFGVQAGDSYCQPKPIPTGPATTTTRPTTTVTTTVPTSTSTTITTTTTSGPTTPAVISRDEANDKIIKTAVHIAAAALGGMLNTVTDEGLRIQIIREFASGTRFFNDNTGYFYLYDYNGICMADGADITLSGQDLSGYTDITGKKVIADFIDTAEKGGGFVIYAWAHPLTRDVQYKVGYVEPVPGTTYLIGSGYYKDSK